MFVASMKSVKTVETTVEFIGPCAVHKAMSQLHRNISFPAGSCNCRVHLWILE